MLKRAFICMIFVVAVEGYQLRHQSLPDFLKNSQHSQTGSPFRAWQHYRLDPWSLRWPSIWRLGITRNNINVASVKRRRRWASFRTRRSKWSKLLSKLRTDGFNAISKQRTPEPQNSIAHYPAPSTNVPKSLASFSHYATPTWLKKLRKKLNHKQNSVDILNSKLAAGLTKDQFSKILSWKWNERRGGTTTVYRGGLQPANFDLENTSDPVEIQGSDKNTYGSPSSNRMLPNPAWQEDLDNGIKLEVAQEFQPVGADSDKGFYPSGDESGDFRSVDNSRDNGDPLLPDLSEGLRQGDKKGDADSSGMLGEGQGFGSSGGVFRDSFGETFGTDEIKSSSGSGTGSYDNSFKHPLEETLQPAERSGSPPHGDDFSSYDSFAPADQDYYSAYMDFDESGFGTFGGFGPLDEGSFVSEDNCDGIETRHCETDQDCACMGMYFCLKGTCSTVSTGTDDKDLPTDMGIWHEAPMTK